MPLSELMRLEFAIKVDPFLRHKASCFYGATAWKESQSVYEQRAKKAKAALQMLFFYLVLF